MAICFLKTQTVRHVLCVDLYVRMYRQCFLEHHVSSGFTLRPCPSHDLNIKVLFYFSTEYIYTYT